MKNKYIFLLAAAICLSSLLSYGQSGRRISHRSSSQDKNAPELYIPTDTINVDMGLLRPPVIVIEGKKTRIGTGVPDAVKMWLVNEISFSFSYRPAKRSGNVLILKDVKVELYLYAPGTARDNIKSRWFCGVQKLHCLTVESEQKMRKYWASLFLPSSYVYMHIPLERGRYTLHNLEGVVIIADRDNNILGRRAFGYKRKLSSARAQRLIAAAAELRGKKVQNQVALWPRQKTPWCWLEAERFELPSTQLDEDAKGSGTSGSSPRLQPEDKENVNGE